MSNRARQAQAAEEVIAGFDAPSRPEVTVLRLHRHGRRLTVPVLMLFVLAVGSGVWLGSFAEGWQNLLALAAAAVLLIALVLLPLLFWLTEQITITTRRVILRRGIFVRHRSEISLSRIREVHSRQSLLQRLFGSGNIEMLVGSESRLIPDVPGVAVAVEALHALVERNYEESLQYTSQLGRRPGEAIGPPQAASMPGTAAAEESPLPMSDTDFWA